MRIPSITACPARTPWTNFLAASKMPGWLRITEHSNLETHAERDEVASSLLFDSCRLKIKPTHECGVFAVFGHPDAAMLTYYGLFALQHRGQESAGIVSAKGSDSPFALHKSMGLVSQVFNPESLERLTGTRAIGHVRYSTTGSSNVKNAQPFVVSTARGQIAIAHNGNLVNAVQLREELEAKGSIFQTTVDSEIVLH